ncbi:MAG: hypothetical protein M3373_09445 [Gemmatimonadota bacterium]|nr:hypothetical protein [Gemmatimonadota bacterium]
MYFVLSADYTVYMDIQQEINLALLRRFREEGIEFALPTRALIVKQQEAGAGDHDVGFGQRSNLLP